MASKTYVSFSELIPRYFLGYLDPALISIFIPCLFPRYDAEPSPVDHQKANVLKFQVDKKPFFEMPSHLADVDLDEYDYEEDFEWLQSTFAEEKRTVCSRSAKHLYRLSMFFVSLVLCVTKYYLIIILPFKENDVHLYGMMKVFVFIQ